MNEQIHIAHLHTNHKWGGSEYQVLNLVKGLVERGVKTTLFAHPYGQLYERAREADLPARPIPSGSLAPVLPFSLSSLCRVVRELGITLLHTHDSLSTTIGIGVKRKTGIPLILARHVASPVRRNIFSRRKYSAKKLDVVLAISETVKEVFAKSGYPRDRIFVVPTGMNIHALSTVQKDEEFRRGFGGAYLVGGIGSLSVKKNWEFMIKVAARVAKMGVDVQWCLAGDGPEERRLRKMADDDGVGARFHILGFRADANRILKSVDVFFFPSLVESSSAAVRTAMALGTPVVAVAVPGTMESLAGHGWGVAAGDVDVAAQSVVEALTDTKKRDATIKAAMESAVSRFAFERTVEGTIAVYEKALVGAELTGKKA
jgi:glycosyltransferase involved in cell wall biosynthesis